MRTKEQSHDYRYFPEPDLPPLDLRRAGIDPELERQHLPELPAPRAARFVERYALSAYDAAVLTATRDVADYYEAVVTAGADPKRAANWVMGPVLADAKVGDRRFGVAPERLAALLALIEDGTVSNQAAKRVFAELAATHEDPRAVAHRLGLVQVADAHRLAGWVDAVLQAHPGEVERYGAGDEKLLGFFMGQIMKASQGKADPKAAQRLLRERLRT